LGGQDSRVIPTPPELDALTPCSKPQLSTYGIEAPWRRQVSLVPQAVVRAGTPGAEKGRNAIAGMQGPARLVLADPEGVARHLP